MKLHREQNIGQNLITACGTDHIDINGLRHKTSLLVLPRQLHEGWGKAGYPALTPQDFHCIIELGCDLLLFGTGRQQHFPPPALLRDLMAARIGVEIMDTAAGCRTFNILVTEGRNVAAALLIES